MLTVGTYSAMTMNGAKIIIIISAAYSHSSGSCMSLESGGNSSSFANRLITNILPPLSNPVSQSVTNFQLTARYASLSSVCLENYSRQLVSVSQSAVRFQYKLKQSIFS